MTDRYGVIGHPIAHSKSPVIHGLFAEQTGQSIRYEAFDIAPAALAEGVRALVAEGLRGFNVTVPHKEAVAKLVDRCTPRAELAGAVNTVLVEADGGLLGDNTDGAGLLRDLEHNLELELHGSRVLVLGAGGAARGVIPALLGTEPAELWIGNRTVARAVELAKRFTALGRVRACSFDELGEDAFDLVINATSAGLHGEVPPFPPDIVDPDTTCYDLSYGMSETPFQHWAKQRAAKAAYQGWGMLVEQAAEAFELWRGVRPDTDQVLQRLPGGRIS